MQNPFVDAEKLLSDTALYKLDDYAKGNREWLWYADGDWNRGQGEDFFDAFAILLELNGPLH